MNVYVHIPFCSNICSYCDFPKVCYHESYINNYLNSLKEEINTRYDGSKVHTLYIGGGTPSSLSIDELNKLLNILKLFKLNIDYEWTFECNIENISYAKLKLLYDNGINRLSFGVQTFNDKLLLLLNRKHNKKDVKNVIDMSHDIGFNNINIDLIYGIPGESMEVLYDDIKEVLSLNINHVSCYSLIIENNTMVKIKGYNNIDEDLEYEMYQYINKELTKKSYFQYEISNYAKPKYESKHNLVYWNNNDYLGLGMSAVSYINNYRITNTKNLTKYINKNWMDKKEYVSEEEKIENEMILGLRKIDGISMKKFYNRYNKNINEVFNIGDLIKEKKLIIDNDNIKINSDYLYLSNEILINFIGGCKNDGNNN